MRCLIFGEPGTGKTTFAATFPGPILWLVCSGGKQPGELRSIDTPENRKKITPRIITDGTQLDSYLRDVPKFATTVLDHATGLADLFLKEILGLDEIPVQKSWGLATREQYGQVGLKMKTVINKIMNGQRNAVILSQEKMAGPEEGADPDIIKPRIGASLSKSVLNFVEPACDYVLQTFIRGKTEEREVKAGNQTIRKTVRVKGVEYCLRTEVDESYKIKFRVPKNSRQAGRVPSVIVDPSYDKLVEIFEK